MVSATRSGTGGGTLEFYLDGAYLNFEYQRPYEFVWPTAKELTVRTIPLALFALALAGCADKGLKFYPVTGKVVTVKDSSTNGLRYARLR